MGSFVKICESSHPQRSDKRTVFTSTILLCEDPLFFKHHKQEI